MNIRAHIFNKKEGRHQVNLRTDQRAHSLFIPPKAEGGGSSVNGGELLFLALATCYCNDLYREAARLGIELRTVDIEVEGEFGGVGEPARNIIYRAKVAAAGTTEQALLDLLAHTDTVAEVQNTLRLGMEVRLEAVEVSVVD